MFQYFRFFFFFFFKQKTAYEMRISDWSSDVCSSDLQTKQAERDEIVVAKQVQLVHEQPVRIEPAITSVPKSVRVEKEKQKTLFAVPTDAGGSGDLPAIGLLDMQIGRAHV